MKKKINLFKTGSKEETPSIVPKIKKPAIWVGMILFIVFLAINAMYLFLKLQLNNYNAKKSDLLKELVANQDTSGQILYFSQKQNQLTTFLKDDVNFLPYYDLLKDLLVFSSNSPVLESMNLDKDKKTSFVVSFETFKQAYDFLHYVESEDFLNNFVTLKLNSLTVSSSIPTQKGYKLSFNGQFRELQ